MQRFKFWPQLALVGALAVANGGCVLIPELKERAVELAIAGTTSQDFTVQSDNTSFDAVNANIDLSTDLDLAQALSDAGIDVSKVGKIALSGISYRIKRADANAAQSITGGTITIQRLAGHPSPVTNLVTGFTGSAGVTSTKFTDVPLDANGVAVVNQLLDDIKAALPGALSTGAMTIHLAGGTTVTKPDFDVEVKLTISITGTVTVKVPT